MKKVLLAAALACAPATARAGGVGRPVAGSPVSDGMAGAFAAIADDPTALYENPAGLGFASPSALVSIETIYAPRSYTPASGGPAQKATAVAPSPVVGIQFHPGGSHHATLAFGAWNTFGGTLSWDKMANPNTPAINSTTDLVYELSLGGGWAFDQHVSIGAALRAGVGVFAVDATAKPSDSNLSGTGVGPGLAAGVLVRFNPKLSVGIGWRSNLDVNVSGSGTVKPGTTDVSVSMSHTQRWPQSASLSAAWRPSSALVVAAQVDWTQWTRFESLDVHTTALDEHFPLDWQDSVSARLGAGWSSGKLALRGGVLFDGNAVPDRTIERQYLDGDKFGVAAGGSYQVSSRITVDVTADGTGGPVRKVPDNSASVPTGWSSQVNVAPGDHSGQVFTLATGLRITL